MRHHQAEIVGTLLVLMTNIEVGTILFGALRLARYTQSLIFVTSDIDPADFFQAKPIKLTLLVYPGAASTQIKNVWSYLLPISTAK